MSLSHQLHLEALPRFTWLRFSLSSLCAVVLVLLSLVVVLIVVFFLTADILLVHLVIVVTAVEPGPEASACEFDTGNHRLELIWTAVPAAIRTTARLRRFHRNAFRRS